MSVSHKGLLLLKNATVNRNLGFDDVCKEKHSIVAYNNEWDGFEVSNMVLHHLPCDVTESECSRCC